MPQFEADTVMAGHPPRSVRTSIWILLLALGLGTVPMSAGDRSVGPPENGQLAAPVLSPAPPGRLAQPAGIRVETEAVVNIPPPLPAVPCTNEPVLGPEMILTEAGRFTMSLPNNEVGQAEDEGPQREIFIVRPFALARCETTVAEFRRFVEETGYVTQAEAGDGCYVVNEAGTDVEQRRDRHWRDPGFPQTDAHPVVCVSWNDAVAYAAWLSRRTGQTYRLPTEAEWEYAARAGSTASRFWGDDQNAGCDYANTADQALKRRYPVYPFAAVTCDGGTIHTAPAGSFKRNAFGFSDMLGNVWEWVRDCYAENLQSVPADGAAWEGQEGEPCARRVVRGGGWDNGPEFARSAARDWYAPDGAFDDLGLRLARDL